MVAPTNPNRINLFDELTLDLARGCVTRSGEPIHLRRQTYEVLRYLVENRGYLISKDKLIEDIWKGRAVTDGSLAKCIEELREALGPEAMGFIRNVRGRGYILDTSVEEAEPGGALATRSDQVDFVRVTVEEHEEIAYSTTANALPAFAAHGSSNRLRNRAVAVAAISVLVLTAFVGYRFLANRASNLSPIKSIAVLPFKNENGNADVEYLSDGMTESLINRLSQLPQLKVIARSSAFEYKGKDLKPEDVSSALGVQAILMGRLSQRGDDLVVSVELMDARDKTQVWGERYTRKAADVQAIQEEISRIVTEKLRLRLTGAQEAQLTRRATQNLQAYQFYLNGLYHLRQVGFDDTVKAHDYFEKAVALDSDFALAWVGVAQANRKFAHNSLSDPAGPVARAKAATEKALGLDNMLAEAHVELAGIKRDEWDWAKADEEYKRAIELNPNLVEAHSWYASYLSIMGRHADALDEIKRAQELDPLSTVLVHSEARLLMLARGYDEAEAKLQHLIKTQPALRDRRITLGMIYSAKGLDQKAVAEYRQVIAADDEMPWRRIILGYALARTGKRGEAEAILDNLKTSKQYVSPAELASLYLALGDKESAMASLEKAFAAHDPQLQYLEVDPTLDTLRDDPRFKNLVRRVGLPS